MYGSEGQSCAWQARKLARPVLLWWCRFLARSKHATVMKLMNVSQIICFPAGIKNVKNGTGRNKNSYKCTAFSTQPAAYIKTDYRSFGVHVGFGWFLLVTFLQLKSSHGKRKKDCRPFLTVLFQNVTSAQAHKSIVRPIHQLQAMIH